MRKIVTVFGSCRQLSISDTYTVTNIQEELTYPHYTKEILQAIQFCKGISSITEEDSAICFRTCILKNKGITWYQCKEEFDMTDVFVIEIASRISYEYKNLYLHHIQADPTSTWKEKDNITIRDLNDDEIEEDIVSIVKLLHPKPVLIVSHFSTYANSKRSILASLLERICLKLNIPFINPSILLCDYTASQLFESEKTLNHYTPFGHSVISQKYKECIDALVDSGIKTL